LPQGLRLFVECGNCSRNWDIDSNAFPVPIRNEVLTCHQCQHQLSVSEGILNHFYSENIFAQYIIRSSWFDSGTVEIRVGQVANVEYNTIPEKVFRVFLTPQKHLIYVEPCGTTSKGFQILSSTGINNEPTFLTAVDVSWLAFGESIGHQAASWKQSLADSKGYELQNDPTMQIVSAEMAFELFIDDFLVNRLQMKPETVEWVQRRTIDEKVSTWYREAIGQTLSAQFPREHSAWHSTTKEFRDKIVHRKYSASPQEGKQAFRAALELISRIDEDWFMK